MPTSLQIDTNKTRTNSTAGMTAEKAKASKFIVHDGTNTIEGTLQVASAGALIFRNDADTSGFSSAASVNFGDTAVNFYATFEVPIVGWSSNVTMTNRAVAEYAYNTSLTDANDTSSFGYGAAGTQFGNFSTATRTKRVRFQTPIQKTDLIFIEVFWNGFWTSLHNTGLQPLSSTTGMMLSNAVVGSTDLDVLFGSAGFSASPAAGASAWSGIDNDPNYLWRVAKISGGAAAGYPIGARNIVGDTTGTAVPAGYIGERKISTGSNSAWTTNQYMDGGNVGLALTPGVWMIKSQHVYTPSSDSAVTSYTYGVGTAAGNDATGMTDYRLEGPASHTPSSSPRFVSPSLYVNISANTTYYPKFRITGTRSGGLVSSDLEAIRVA
jgi:hypothetical protein